MHSPQTGGPGQCRLVLGSLSLTGKTMGKPWENGDLYNNYVWLVVWNMAGL